MLPKHGRINCKNCYSKCEIKFDVTKEEHDGWRISANPLAWGSQKPKVVVLGFSKGPTQVGALNSAKHNDIAYKGSRLNVGKIMSHVGLIPKLDDNEQLKREVDKLIANETGDFHFGSLIRCTVQRFDLKDKKWKGSGGGMLDKFVATNFGHSIAKNCTREFLSDLPTETKLVLMFGLGTKQNYVRESFELFKNARSGDWSWINDVAYTDGRITVVHVEHFASQGAFIPNWLGINDHARSNFGILAQQAVTKALNYK